MEELKRQFTEDMRRLCIEIKNASHNPSRFIQMLTDGDSVEVVKRLIMNEPTDTFLKLAAIRKLNLTVEYYVVMSKYQPLFSEEEIIKCKERLELYKY